MWLDEKKNALQTDSEGVYHTPADTPDCSEIFGRGKGLAALADEASAAEHEEEAGAGDEEGTTGFRDLVGLEAEGGGLDGEVATTGDGAVSEFAEDRVVSVGEGPGEEAGVVGGAGEAPGVGGVTGGDEVGDEGPFGGEANGFGIVGPEVGLGVLGEGGAGSGEERAGLGIGLVGGGAGEEVEGAAAGEEFVGVEGRGVEDGPVGGPVGQVAGGGDEAVDEGTDFEGESAIEGGAVAVDEGIESLVAPANGRGLERLAGGEQASQDNQSKRCNFHNWKRWRGEICQMINRQNHLINTNFIKNITNVKRDVIED